MLFELERHREAVAPLQRAAELDPQNAFVQLSLGILFMEYLGQHGDAATHFQNYQRLDGSDERVRRWLRDLGR